MQRVSCAAMAALAFVVIGELVVIADLKVSTTYCATTYGTTYGTTHSATHGAFNRTHGADSNSLVVPTFLGPPKLAGEGGRSAREAGKPAALEPAIKAAGDLPRLHSLLVSQRGAIVLERYFNGRRETTPANVKSVSKSVISALIGIAADRKLLSLDRTMGDYFPDLPKEKRGITIEHLLIMQSGLESTSNRNYGAWVQSSNWVRHALAKPLLAAPGTQMIYSTGNTHILSAILTKATGKSTWQFAQETLAKPLGFTLPQWVRDPQGVYFGGNEMVMTPRQMLTFGEMYRNSGQANGRQILSKEFIDETFEPRGRSRISGREYGYGWWMREMDGRKAYYAWGFGGQYIVLVPSLDLTVVSTSAATVGEDRREHRRTVEDIIEQFVVAALGS